MLSRARSRHIDALGSLGGRALLPRHAHQLIDQAPGALHARLELGQLPGEASSPDSGRWAARYSLAHVNNCRNHRQTERPLCDRLPLQQRNRGEKQ